jgi:uncharacterized protein (UPF0333 family)
MEKIKLFFNEKIQSEKGKDILTVIVVILVGLGSFILGRLSNSSEDIKTDNRDQNIQDNNSQSEDLTQTSINDSGVGHPNSTSSGKTFFASSKGKKYYTENCSAGKTIKQENKIYFTTGEEAQAAGYTLSSSCK